MKFNKLVSSSRRKQRKRHFTATGTDLTKKMTSPLSKQLKEEIGIKRIPVRPNDRVLINVGKFKKREGKIIKVNRRDRKICVEDCTIVKKDGAVKYIGIDASNLTIVGLSMEKDRERIVARLKGIRK